MICCPSRKTQVFRWKVLTKYQMPLMKRATKTLRPAEHKVTVTGSKNCVSGSLAVTSGIGEGSGSPLQCSCLENPRDGGAWWAAVHGVVQSRTRLKWLSSSGSAFLSKLYLFFIPDLFNTYEICSKSCEYVSSIRSQAVE